MFSSKGSKNATLDGEVKTYKKEYMLIKQLEVGDTITEDVVNAYNRLKESERRVYHHGRPAVSDKVIWMKQNEVFKPDNKRIQHVYPLPNAIGETVSAVLYISPEMERHRKIKIDLIAGGRDCNNFTMEIKSGDSGAGNKDDPYVAIAFGTSKS